MSHNFSLKIQQIKERINIVDVIGSFLKLQRKASNFWAVCPFHEDSNPSMSISQDKQIYKCFSCDDQGNVFTFLQKYKNFKFIAAVKEAAKIAGINLKDFDLEFTDNQEESLHAYVILNNIAMNFFQYQLTTVAAKEALNYLESRNIDKEKVELFALGYAPNNNQLLNYLKTQGFKENEIISAGLAKITDSDRVHDLFNDRIIFPIIDIDGNCHGFSSREYKKNRGKEFKYINTPETEIFKKSKLLYNLFNAKQFVSTKTNFIYLVEGYMDVIALYGVGIKNCVALMGTNLTLDHINIIKKITSNITVFLDGDEAGKNASVKIATLLLQKHFNTKIVNNLTDNDPDELINVKQADFQKIAADVVHPLDFLIELLLKKYDIVTNSYHLQEFLKAIKPVWATLNDPITIKFYLNQLIKITNLSEKELISILEIKKTTKSISKPKSINKPLTYKQRLIEIQKELLALVLLNKKIYLFLEQKNFIFYSKNLMTLYFLVAQEYNDNSDLEKINLEIIYQKLESNEIIDYFKDLINKYYNRIDTKTLSLKEKDINNFLIKINNFLIEIEVEEIGQKIINTKAIQEKLELLKKQSLLKHKKIKINKENW